MFWIIFPEGMIKMTKVKNLNGTDDTKVPSGYNKGSLFNMG